MPTGDRVTIGHGQPVADISIRDLGAILEIVREGLTGFAEAYMSGRIDTSDLDRLIAWGLANQKAWFDHPLAVVTSPIRRLWQRIRPERRHSRVRTMNEHYNLGNDFYAAWLDPTMTYSSARFQHPQQTLEEAQRHKYRTMSEHARLAPGMRVLEIGCGWGGFAEYAANEIGCEVVGITLAKEHAGYAEKRIANAGLADMVDIRIEDFRNTDSDLRCRGLNRDDRIDRREPVARSVPDHLRPPRTGSPGRDADHHHRRPPLGAVSESGRLHPAVHFPGWTVAGPQGACVASAPMPVSRWNR